MTRVKVEKKGLRFYIKKEDDLSENQSNSDFANKVSYKEAQRAELALMGVSDNMDFLLEDADEVSRGVYIEFLRQYNKWGDQYHDIFQWQAITTEEYLEFVKDLNIVGFDDEPHNEHIENAMRECIEMIACAVQTYHALKMLRDGIDTSHLNKPMDTPAEVSEDGE